MESAVEGHYSRAMDVLVERFNEMTSLEQLLMIFTAALWIGVVFKAPSKFGRDGIYWGVLAAATVLSLTVYTGLFHLGTESGTRL